MVRVSRVLSDSIASELGIEMPFHGLRSRTGTDGVVPLRAGFPCVSLKSVTEHKMQTAYHWPTDTADKVDLRTLASAAELCETVARRLPVDWPLARAYPATNEASLSKAAL